MARFSRLKVLTTILDTGVVPIFYHPDPETVVKVIEACAAGGVRCFEFTNRGDGAHEVFSTVIRQYPAEKGIVLGAGSILDPATAALYIQMGANFIVGPCLNSEVARLCNRRKVAYMPGCGSASEISAAEELGVEICKVFPGSAVGGPEFVRDMLGPMPWTRLMPTGGVEPTEESIRAWLGAGVACVGLGSKLFSKEVIAAGNYELITQQVRQVVSWIAKTRAGKSPIQ
jgi:2-dehydro-3-deoxyphosphogluconate aldolase/(4S)-4-hydroxy-2-oxoglutarate aldolase